MIKINLHFIGNKDGEVQDQEFTLEEACGDKKNVKKLQTAFGQCGLIDIGVGTGKSKMEDPFLYVSAISGKKEGKHRFKVHPMSGYFWFTWINGQGGGLSFASYGSARFEYDGNTLEIEKEGG